MIVIRANHDLPTNYLYLWSNNLINLANKKDFNVIKIEGKDMREEIIRSRIKKKKPRFIFFNGHGSQTSLYDNDQNPFINLDSADIFKDTVAFTRACSALEKLGTAAIKKGCNAFIGYNREFWIARDHSHECQPLKDGIAKPVMESSNIIVKELIKSKTVSQAVQKSHEKAGEYILDLIFSKEPLAPAILQALVANDTALGFKGKASATL